MSNTAKASNEKFTGYGMIFLGDNPIIDNPAEVPVEAWQTLTAEQKNYANSQVPAELQRND
jgi:hypothetical protein